MHISLAYKLSTTSSNKEIAEGDALLSTRLSLKSFASLEAPGGPIVTKNYKGTIISAIDVLNVPAAFEFESVYC